MRKGWEKENMLIDSSFSISHMYQALQPRTGLGSHSAHLRIRVNSYAAMLPDICILAREVVPFSLISSMICLQFNRPRGACKDLAHAHYILLMC